MLDLFAVTYSYSSSSNLTDAEAAGIIGGLLAGMLIPLIIYYVLLIIAQWKLFEKAGRQGWKALIPFYNMYILTEISGQSGWLFLLCLIPGVGTIIWTIMVALKLAPAFGKDTGFAVGLILLGPIFQMILGFGSAEYKLAKPAGAAAGTAAAPKNDSWENGGNK